MEANRLPTLREILAKSERYLSDKGVDSPRLSAQLVAAKALGVDRLRLFLDMDRHLTDDELAAIRPLLRRRGEGEPMAYILGEREFYGLDFKVTKDVLIPRPETELLVEEVLRRFPHDARISFADFGTGSGALAVTVAKNLPGSRAVAVDLCPAALEVARENGRRHGVEKRVEFLLADFGAMPAPGAFFDLVLANPPYLSEAELATVSREVSCFEPTRALVAGKQGSEAIRVVAREAGRLLRQGGVLLMEIGYAQGPETLELFEDKAAGWHSVRVLKDLSGHDRILTAER